MSETCGQPIRARLEALPYATEWSRAPDGVEPKPTLRSRILLAYTIAGLVVATDMLTKRWAAIAFRDEPGSSSPAY